MADGKQVIKAKGKKRQAGSNNNGNKAITRDNNNKSQKHGVKKWGSVRMALTASSPGGRMRNPRYNEP